MWDGLEFFGFDLKKVPRLDGERPQWKDKFTNIESTPILLITAVIFTYIFVVEVDKIIHWHQKSQTI